MKRLSAIFLTFLLVISSVGVTVSRHYCGTMLIDTSLVPHIADACNPDMPMDPEDCSDEHDAYIVDSPKIQLDNSVEFTPVFTWIEKEETLLMELTFTSVLPYKYFADLPPPLSEPDIFTRDQAFLL